MVREKIQTPLEASITKEFLEQTLKRKIVDYKTSGGSNPGDNFTSVLLSIEVYVVGETKPLYLLFKTFPGHPTRQKLLEETNLFLKEYLVYDVWLPELIGFQKEIIGNDEILKLAMPELVAGAAIDYENEEVNTKANPMLKNFILMVDVRKTWGFQMADKLRSLGYHHVKVVLEELAKFHALSYAYKVHKNLPNARTLFPFLEDPFFCNPNQKSTIDAMATVNLEIIKETLQEFLNEQPDIAESLKRLEEPGKVSEMFAIFLNPEGMDEEKVESFLRVNPKQSSGPPLKDQWIVGGHGDCWTNNMLFKSDDTGKVVETILVDLQIARESCIMADIIYFIYTSTDTAFRRKYLEEMLALYHEKFVGFCKTLKVEPYNGFTLENFKRKFHRSKFFGFLFASFVLPIILQKPSTSIDLDTVEVLSDDEKDGFSAMFKNDTRDEDDKRMLRERFVALLTELHEEGVL